MISTAATIIASNIDGLGGWGMFAAPATTTTAATTGSVLSAMGTAAGHSLITGAVSAGSISMINSGLNGRIDLSQLGQDLSSKESLKSLGIGAVTAGIGAGVGERLGGALRNKWGIGLKLTSEMDMSQRVGSLATQTVINSGVRTGLAGISGEDIGSIWQAESLSSTLAMGQSVIGDIGQELSRDNNNSPVTKELMRDGGLGKVAMHGTVGGLYSQAMGGSFTSGAIGGGVGELAPSLLSDRVSDGAILTAASVVTSGISLLTGGSVSEIQSSVLITQSAVQYNAFGHRDPKIDKEVAALSDEEIRRQYLEMLSGSGVLIPENAYNPREVALASEYNKRFSSDVAQRHVSAIPEAIRGVENVPVFGRMASELLISGVEYSSGKPLRVDGEFASVDGIGSRLGLGSRLEKSSSPATKSATTPVITKVTEPATGGVGVTGPPVVKAKKYWSEGVMVNGKKVFQRNDLINPLGFHPKHDTNLEAMKKGVAPIGSDGQPINLHHLGRRNDGSIAEMTASFHQKNTKTIHINPSSTESGIDRQQFKVWRQQYWKERAEGYISGD